MSVSAVNVQSMLPQGAQSMTRRDLTPKEQAHKAAGQFEAILVRQLIGESVGKMLSGGAKDSEAGDQVYGYMMTDALAQKITEGGGLGLSRMLEKQLTPKGALHSEVKHEH